MTPEELGRSLGRIEAKQDAILDRVEQHLDDDVRVHGEHDVRLRDLEKSRARQQGLAAGVAAVVGGAAGLLAKFWHGA